MRNRDRHNNSRSKYRHLPIHNIVCFCVLTMSSHWILLKVNPRVLASPSSDPQRTHVPSLTRTSPSSRYPLRHPTVPRLRRPTDKPSRREHIMASGSKLITLKARMQPGMVGVGLSSQMTELAISGILSVRYCSFAD